MTLNTRAIQTAVDNCSYQGGGTVVIPAGVFLSGAIFFQPGVNLELSVGAVLKGSTNIEDYPRAITRIEGHFEPWRTALLNGSNLDRLCISGPGTLDGNGAPYWHEFYRRIRNDPKTTNLNVERPRLVFLQNCRDVRITGVNFKDSGFWNLHLYRCQRVLVDTCSFRAPHGRRTDNAPSSDGMDVDSSQDITITNSFFSVGDDCIALKGSKGPFAMQDTNSPPVERIHIYGSTFEAGGGIVTFGSEATIVRDVDVERCTSTGPVVLRLKLRPDTQQQYENIHLRDITLSDSSMILNISPWRQYFDLQGQPPPKSLVRNITITGVKGSGGSLGVISGGADVDFGDIVLKDVDVNLKTNGIHVSNAKGLNLQFQNVTINGASVPDPAALSNVPAK
jgi:polygalacturonase